MAFHLVEFRSEEFYNLLRDRLVPCIYYMSMSKNSMAINIRVLTQKAEVGLYIFFFHAEGRDAFGRHYRDEAGQLCLV